nr:alpha-taxilin like [Tanacetum cinerariifolium]
MFMIGMPILVLPPAEMKETMDSTMDEVIMLMIEVEREEKVSEEAKEEAIKSGFDILEKMDERKQAHDDVLLNHVGDEWLILIDGVGIERIRKKDDKGMPKEPNKEWKLNDKTVPHKEEQVLEEDAWRKN